MLLRNYRTLLIIAALPLIVSSQAAAEEKGKPFNLNAIGFTADCNPNDTFQRLMTLMVGNGNADPNLYESVSGEIERELHLDNTVSWNGLQLSGVHLYFGIERGPANYTLKFDNSATEVRKAWNDLGWNLPNIDDGRGCERA